jgi:serine/threonine protein kinase
MGAVYKVRQPKLQRLAALKILPPEFQDDPAFEARFTREAQALAALDHPGIVTIYDFGFNGTSHWILMEFVDGPHLGEVTGAGPLPPAEALAIASQLCDALAYAHDRGIVHRDIKPSNILLASDGHVELTDFGLARLGERLPGDVTLTAPNATLGTPAYMAPELLEGCEADRRADLYGLGVVLYQLLTGKLPLGNFDPPSTVTDAPVSYDAIVLRAMASDPQQRYQHARDLLADLQHASTTKTRKSTAPRPRRSKVLAATAVAALLGIVAIFLATRPPSEPSPKPSLAAASFDDLLAALPNHRELSKLTIPELRDHRDLAFRILERAPEHELAQDVFLVSANNLAEQQMEALPEQGVETLERDLERFARLISPDALADIPRGHHIRSWRVAADLHLKLGNHERALEITRVYESVSRRIAMDALEDTRTSSSAIRYLWLPANLAFLLTIQGDALIALNRTEEAIAPLVEALEMLVTQYRLKAVLPTPMENMLADCDRLFKLLLQYRPEDQAALRKHAQLLVELSSDPAANGKIPPHLRISIDRAREKLGDAPVE